LKIATFKRAGWGASAVVIAAACGVAIPLNNVLAAPAAAPAPGSFQICAACHTVSSDRAHGMGPNLRGVVGRQAGAAPGFAYSAAMKRAGFRWTEADLDAFLAAPRAKVPGNSMAYTGMKDPIQRAQIIKYLKGLR
jgi:cytochrome c